MIHNNLLNLIALLFVSEYSAEFFHFHYRIKQPVWRLKLLIFMFP